MSSVTVKNVQKSFGDTQVLRDFSQEFGDGEFVTLLGDVYKRQVLDCDALFLGSPTYFGNVSAPVKTFMDSFVDYWVEARLAGKFFGGFASAGTPQGGADICLQALCHFAMHMGMCILSVPSTVSGTVQPAYGVVHWSGDNSDHRLEEGGKEAIRSYCAYAMGIIAGKVGEK